MQVDYLEFKRIMKSLGITDENFITTFHEQLFGVDRFSRNGLEFVVGFLKSMRPKDSLEAMFMAQMAVVHCVTMKHFVQVGEWHGTELQERAVNAATKLARTFAAQLDAFNRYRGGGEQKVTVQNVSVQGGQAAVVGHLNQTKAQPALEKPQDQSPALTNSPQEPMSDLETERLAWLEYVERKQKSSS